MSEITNRARKLRSSMTKAEKLLWGKIRDKKLGVKFRRQYPIIFFENKIRHCFIADFVCLNKNLILEIDGEIHDFQKDYDKARSYIINQLGFDVIRFNNNDIYFDIEKVLTKIKSIIQI